MSFEVFLQISVCKVITSWLNNIWLFLLTCTHCLWHTFLKLLCPACLSVNWNSLRNSLFNVVVDSIFCKSSYSFFSVQVNATVITNDSLVLSRHYTIADCILINIILSSLIRLLWNCRSRRLFSKWCSSLRRNSTLIRARRRVEWRTCFFRILDNWSTLCFSLQTGCNTRFSLWSNFFICTSRRKSIRCGSSISFRFVSLGRQNIVLINFLTIFTFLFLLLLRISMSSLTYLNTMICSQCLIFLRCALQ